MIEGYGRGIIAGGQEANAWQAGLPDSEELQRMAQNAYASMKAAGYAQIEPESEFLRGFVDGFRFVVLFVERIPRIE